MGIGASRGRVKHSLSNSPEFNAACDSAYANCLSLTQHAFPGVFPYQLQAASDYIHSTLLAAQGRAPTLVARWVPRPPSRGQINSAVRCVLGHREEADGAVLGGAEFKEWALLLYAEAVVGNAGKAVLARVPIGVAGILGVGAVTRSGKGLVGTAVGVYALGVATSIYLGLSA